MKKNKKINILHELRERNLLNNITSEEKLNNLAQNAGVYIGFDPTNISLHLGNYVQIKVLKWFEKADFKIYALVGGATALIGDPADKEQEREIQSKEKIKLYKRNIIRQLKKFKIKTIDNFQFYKNYKAIDFFRAVGKKINVSYMLNKEFVKSRLDSGISFTEFAYQIFQAWDFAMMYKKHLVKIQIGGSDQWGNITSGLEMIRKEFKKDDALGITINLLKTSDGKKIGKSKDQVMFLDKTLCSPYNLYQYFLNTTDKDVKQFLLWFTDLTIKKIKTIIVRHEKQSFKKEAQKILAFEVVKDIHSPEEAEMAKKISNMLFQECINNLENLNNKERKIIEKAIPTFYKIHGNILQILVKIQAAVSKREAKEFISQNTIMVNGKVVKDFDFQIPKSKTLFLIKRGKRNYYLIKN